MKLNTLLLTSAATLMVTSVAFAADLPSKKAAPAGGSVQVCKVGETHGFTMPDTGVCLDIGGRVTFDASYNLDSESNDGTSDSSMGAGYRLHVDASANTEVGVVRTFIQLEGGSALGSSGLYETAGLGDYVALGSTSKDVATTRRAYVQFAGFTVGKKDSLADVYGTQSNQLGNWSQSNIGADYKLNAGGVTFGVGVEKANSNDWAYNTLPGSTFSEFYTLTSYNGDRPDLVAQIGGKAGPVGFTVAAVSHEAFDPDAGETVNGYALMGNINAKIDNFGVFAFGGTANAAGNYISANSLSGQAVASLIDALSGEELESTVYGGGLNFTMGKTFINFEMASYEHKLGAEQAKYQQYDVYLSHTIAKGLTVQPEYMLTKTEGADDAHSLYLRIQRDF